MLKPGDPMPDVTLDGPDGQRVRLRDRVGAKALVVYFYPKDDTAGCTAEACSFRDSYEDFVQAGADVIGVSGDGADSHARFARKHGLQFMLLSDTKGEARKAFDVGKALLGLTVARVTFVFDREGKVRHAFEANFNMQAHARDALRVVREIAAGH